MPTIIYTDTSGVNVNGTLLNTSPAGTYGLSTIEQILDNISRGIIQTGTGHIYPIDWTSDQTPPWENTNPWMP